MSFHFESVDEILKLHHSIEGYKRALSCGHSLLMLYKVFLTSEFVNEILKLA